jgi:hypothetical protein
MNRVNNIWVSVRLLIIISICFFFGAIASTFAAGEPTVINVDVISITQTSATPRGEVTDEGLAPVIGVWIEYGTTDSYGTEVQRFNLNELTFPGIFDVPLTGLTCGTTYHYRFRVRNNALLDGFSPDATFATSPCDQEPDPVSFAGGTGTELVPYQITTCEQLQAINQDLDASYELMSDIDCSGTATWNPNENEWVDGVVGGELIPDDYEGVVNNGYFGFEPIGQDNNINDGGLGFSGTFDGNDFTISDLWIFRKNTNFGGIFGYASNATIRNVTVIDANIVGGNNTGGILGYGESVTLENLTNENGMVRAYLAYYGGGIAGSIHTDSFLENASVINGTVHGSGNTIGGLIGYVFDSTVSNSNTSADVDGGEDIGGAFGYVDSAIIATVEATGNVESDLSEGPFAKSGRYAGGFAGRIINSQVNDSFATGNINSESESAGGFAGRIDESTIINSYATGNVAAVDSNVGGFAGQIWNGSEFVDTYATGTVSGASYIGGFAGSAYCGPSFIRAYALGNVTATGDNIGGFVGSDGCEGPGASYREVSAYGNVTGNNNVGGFVGESVLSDFNDVYASGDVTGIDDVGGFGGSVTWGQIDNAYARGDVIGTGLNTGGFIGIYFIGENNLIITNSFFDTEASGQLVACEDGDCSGVTGKTTLEMKMASTFIDAGWNFTDVWEIDSDNDGYPHFTWENLVNEPFELLTLSAENITQTSATLRGQVVAGEFPEGSLGFAFSDAPINIEGFGGEDLGEGIIPVGPADDFGTIDNESGEYTLDLNLYFAEDERLLNPLECGTEYYYIAIGFTTEGENTLEIAQNQISFTTLPCTDEPEPRRRTTSGGRASSATLAQMGIVLSPYSSNNNSQIEALTQQLQQLQTLVLQLQSQGASVSSSATSLTCQPFLRQGSRGSEVALLQTKLGIPSDGIFGIQTTQAVRSFQQVNNLLVDGIAGSETCAVLSR